MGYRWKRVKDRPWLPWALVIVLFGAVLGYAGIISVDLSAIGVELGPAAIDRTVPEDVPVGSEPVTLKIMADHELDRGNPGATPVRLYTDAEGTDFLASASTSSGIATFTGVPIWEGETLYYQCRVAAPAASGFVTYTTPLTEFVVPLGDEASIASYGPISLWEVSTSVATFAVDDQDGNTVNTEATDFVNTTDTSLDIKVSITADCAFGSPSDWTDYDTGKNYLSGAWLVITTTTTQDIINAYDHFYENSLHYYVFRMDMIIRDSDKGYLSPRIFLVDTGTASFTASTDFDFDIYDICQLNGAGRIDSNSFKDGDSDLAPAALANKVA